LGDKLTNFQCPNCQQYKTKRKDGWYQPDTQRLTTQTGWKSIGYGLGALAVLWVMWRITLGNSLDLNLWGYSCLGIIVLAAAFGIVAELFRRAGMRRALPWVQFSCGNCGYHWQWVEGQAWPYPWLGAQLLPNVQTQPLPPQQTQQLPGYPPPAPPAPRKRPERRAISYSVMSVLK